MYFKYPQDRVVILTLYLIRLALSNRHIFIYSLFHFQLVAQFFLYLLSFKKCLNQQSCTVIYILVIITDNPFIIRKLYPPFYHSFLVRVHSSDKRHNSRLVTALETQVHIIASSKEKESIRLFTIIRWLACFHTFHYLDSDGHLGRILNTTEMHPIVRWWGVERGFLIMLRNVQYDYLT